MPRPAAADSAEFYHKYIELVEAESVKKMINNYAAEIVQFYCDLPDEKQQFAYAPKKWSVKEVLQHVTDTERIFIYRVLRISRNDSTPLASFDENMYVSNSESSQRNFTDLKNEFAAVRKSSDLLLQSFSDEQLNRRGTASNFTVSVNAIAFIMYGHLLHHLNIFTERYCIS